MKIGILTHHYVKNFGAGMQAEGLLKTIREQFPDADVQIIDYRVKKHLLHETIHYFGYKPSRGDSFAGYIEKMKLFFTQKSCEDALPHTRRVYSGKDIDALGLDLVIVGSDEVWNYQDRAFSGIKFGHGFNTPVISYAASVGGSTDEENISEEIISGLKRFDAISVRDDVTEKFVKNVAGIDAVRVLDPVFLYDYHLKFGKKIRDVIKEKPYILIYDCKLMPSQIDIITEYAKEKNLNIIGAGEYRKYYDSLSTVNITTLEWAALFKHARYVITGTFHGTSFSIKYNRKFVSFVTEINRVNKVSSLLKTFGLEDKMVTKTEETNLIDVMRQKIDYEKVNKIVEEKAVYSKKYLSEQIELHRKEG